MEIVFSDCLYQCYSNWVDGPPYGGPEKLWGGRLSRGGQVWTRSWTGVDQINVVATLEIFSQWENWL